MHASIDRTGGPRMGRRALVMFASRESRPKKTKKKPTMLGGWVNPHRGQQTIPQGQTSSPPKSFFTPTTKARPDQAALATSAEARGATHRARPRSPSRTRTLCLGRARRLRG